jgi:hypothetical protein
MKCVLFPKLKMTEKKALLLQVDVGDYKFKCPHCLGNILSFNDYYRVNPKTDEQYLEYVGASFRQFGEYSLPLCYQCWRSNCEKCHGCRMPMGEIAFSGAFGSVLLKHTTVTPGDWLEHVCDACKTRGYEDLL